MLLIHFIKKMAELNVKQQTESTCKHCRVIFFICLFTSISLIVGGFFVPPTGIIDGSVLTAVGELIVFPALAFGFRALELGYDVKMQKGETSIEIDND